jgi:AraC-like DNA-binding protein
MDETVGLLTTGGGEDLPVEESHPPDDGLSPPAPVRAWLPPGVESGVHIDVPGAPGGLLHVGEGWVGEAHEIAWHVHPGWEIYLQLHGRSTWQVASRTVQLGPGWLLAVPPGTPHHGVSASRWRGRHQFTYAMVDLSSRPGDDLDPDLRAVWSGRSATWVPEAWSVAAGFRTVLAEVAHDRLFAPTGIAAATTLLLCQVGRLLVEDGAVHTDLVRHPAVARARRMLDEDPTHPWTLHELAAACRLSRTRLSELFRAEVGQPPYDYVLARRVERAAELLTTTPYSVSEVASLVGFATRTQLTRHFRRLRGTTPLEWRRRGGAGS